MTTDHETRGSRRELRDRLRADAVLQNGPEVTLVGRDGRRAIWMFDSWAVSMTPDGLRLAAGELLAELDGFTATQLAATGRTAAPLLAGCLLLGDGRYTGLTVRDHPKPYGPRWLVEGRGDRSRPVVVIDDSLSSGRSFARAARALERDGYRVEGLVALVDFSTRGGREWIEAVGYRVRTLFDAWADLDPPMPAYQPGHLRPAPPWSTHAVPAGLHPAQAARWVAEHMIDTGTVALPPPSIDARVDARGGAFVSIRRADDSRIGRGGYWHFDPGDAQLCRDVVLATVRTLLALPELPSRAELDRAKIAVSFLTPLERVPPAELDYGRYGLVVRSLAFPYKAGGALPNTQLFTSTQEQLRHARKVNGGIAEFEPYEVFRQEITKSVEPGQTWPAYGVAEHLTDGWTTDAGLGDALVSGVRGVLGAPDAGNLAEVAGRLPRSVSGAAVTIYQDGASGAGLSWAAPIGDALCRAARAAAADLAVDPVRTDATVLVTLLHDREFLGPAGVAGLAAKLRPGRDAIAVRDGRRGGLFLETVVPHGNWTSAQAAAALARRTGVSSRAAWSTYKAASWCWTAGHTRRLAYGYVDRTPDSRLELADRELLEAHLVRRLDADGWPAPDLWPGPGATGRPGAAQHSLHALGALLRADRVEAAAGVGYAVRHLDPAGEPSLRLPGRSPDFLADARLLDAVVAAPRHRSAATDSLAAAVARWVRTDGSVRPPGITPVFADADILPGVALRALGRYARATGWPPSVDHAAALRYSRRRFRLLHPWGFAAWQALGWTEFARLHDDDDVAAGFVFELADWMVERQLRADGSFLTTQSAPAPSVAVALIAGAVATAAGLAAERGEDRRAERYRRSWRQALWFLDRLMIRPEDTYWMPDAAAAVGGVRGRLASGELRVDYTSYTLDALLAGRAL